MVFFWALSDAGGCDFCHAIHDGRQTWLLPDCSIWQLQMPTVQTDASTLDLVVYEDREAMTYTVGFVGHDTCPKSQVITMT